MKQIHTNRAPKALGPYSQAMVVDNFCFVSMQLPIDPKTGQIEQNIKYQAEQVIKNIESILIEAGFSLNNVVKSTLYITDLNDFNDINEIYAKYFTHKPARSLILQSDMPKSAKVALEVIAYRVPDDTDELDYQSR